MPLSDITKSLGLDKIIKGGSAGSEDPDRDLVDDLIDIQRDWQQVSNPLSGVADTLAQDPSKVRVFDPGDYKHKPRANSIFCLEISSKDASVCGQCLEVCPTDAITIDGKSVHVSEEKCRKCGLCVAACPTECLLDSHIMPNTMYEKIARVCGEYEQCYITCTRALGRLPKPNEVVLPCVGALSLEVWVALLEDYDNISIYLPLGVCDRCRTTTGEACYSDRVARAEELTANAVGLEVDESAMNHEEKRLYKRAQFFSAAAQAGETVLMRSNPMLAGAKALNDRMRAHSDQLVHVQRSLENAVGVKTTSNRRRILTQRRKLLLTTIQNDPPLARRVKLDVPQWDPYRCTMCGDCVRACPEHACDLDETGRFSVEPAYCVNCGACVAICPDKALAMAPVDPDDMVVVDEDAERRKAQAQEQKERAEKLAKKSVKRGLDVLDRVADSLASGSDGDEASKG